MPSSTSPQRDGDFFDGNPAVVTGRQLLAGLRRAEWLGQIPTAEASRYRKATMAVLRHHGGSSWADQSLDDRQVGYMALRYLKASNRSAATRALMEPASSHGGLGL